MPNVVDNEDLYNVIVLNGKPSPGVVTLSGHDRKTEWDVQNAPFQMGARVRFKARPPIEFTATFYLLKDIAQGVDDFAAWDAFVPTIHASISNPRAPAALTIYHPDLAANGIKSVVEAKTGGFVYDGRGGAHVTVTFQEYVPPRKMEGAPTPTPPNDPNAAMKAQLSALTQRFQQTPWQ